MAHKFSIKTMKFMTTCLINLTFSETKNVFRGQFMSVDFLTTEQKAEYGQFFEDTDDIQLSINDINDRSLKCRIDDRISEITVGCFLVAFYVFFPRSVSSKIPEIRLSEPTA